MSLTKALERSRGVVSAAHAEALRLKQAGILTDQVPAPSVAGGWQYAARYGRRYSLYRGWVYSAVNAIASECAGQGVNVARVVRRGKTASRLSSTLETKTPSYVRAKAMHRKLELLPEHPVLESLKRPNPIQYQWQFVYSFVANLNLTGWAFIVGGFRRDTIELYALPTTWVHPRHEKGPFSTFTLRNPAKPTAQTQELKRNQVAFAHLPNPSDPLSAYSPAGSQILSIRIDDHIQTCQERFFGNGIFPSVIVTIGRNPHPDVPGGIRPRLTGAQRRQVIAAIQKTMSGVANYGAPAIIDGLIEKIERLSATQNELGWEKSEQTIRTRILSAFGVHPYILGEPVNVGGYAQAANIEKRFYKRVNTFLEMLGNVLTNFVNQWLDDEEIVIWWDKAEPHDPSLYWQNVRFARQIGDIDQDEFRSLLGFPPDKDGNQAVINRQLLGGIVQLLGMVGDGKISSSQAQAVIEGLGVPTDVAERVALGAAEQEQQEQAAKVLKEAVRLLSVTPDEVAEVIADG